MTIAVQDTDLSVCNLERRMSFHFGNVHVTRGPQVLLELEASVDGSSATGTSMGALAPMWFHKDPDASLEDGIDGMIEVFQAARDVAESAGEHASPFDLWRAVYDELTEWGTDTPHPQLLVSYGASLIEQAAIDAFCRARETTFPKAVHENELGIDLGSIHDDLDGRAPTDLLPSEPVRRTAVRHTVGLSDPLVPDDVPADERLDDGLPQTLSEYVESQGVDHFKIKLAANEGDADRLARIESTLDAAGLDEYAVTLDANEQYESVASFRRQYERMRDEEGLAEFLEHLLYVEQPLPRDQAFTDETRRAFAEWTDRPPVIIDESDDRLESLERALDCGYAGTSHKNCKGVFKGIANRCLIEARRLEGDDRSYLLSGEDLTTLGPIELGEDLAVMATLGMDHVERNGHHYYRGLSMFPEDVQDRVIERHGDLYRRHEQGYATLDIRDGEIELDSVLAAPFGHDVPLSADRFTPVEEWSIDAIAE